MAQPNPPVLLDNCAISACVAAGGWTALVARYCLETVEEVASEQATGAQHRVIIPPDVFRQQVTVHAVSRSEILERQIAFADLATLDDGERDLWVHALGREDAFILCGPDIASIKFGVERGLGHRLVSLEELLERIGYRPKSKLPHNQTKAWLRDTIGRFEVDRAFARRA